MPSLGSTQQQSMSFCFYFFSPRSEHLGLWLAETVLFICRDILITNLLKCLNQAHPPKLLFWRQVLNTVFKSIWPDGFISSFVVNCSIHTPWSWDHEWQALNKTKLVKSLGCTKSVLYSLLFSLKVSTNSEILSTCIEAVLSHGTLTCLLNMVFVIKINRAFKFIWLTMAL